MTNPAPLLTICAPAFNEAACIVATVQSWLHLLDAHGLDGEVVVANDGSRDATGALLDELAAADQRVRPVHLPHNQGYGRALRAAIGQARGTFVATMDADGQFDPQDILRLLDVQRTSDLDLVNGRRRKRDTLIRVAADRGLNLTVRALFATALRDTNCALKLVRRDWLQQADLRATGFATPTELVLVASHAGLRIAEVDIAHLERAGGASKLRVARTSLDMLQFLVALRRRLAEAP